MYVKKNLTLHTYLFFAIPQGKTYQEEVHMMLTICPQRENYTLFSFKRVQIQCL